ncbi:hypothetical protein [Thalassiella azotivora]
MPHSHRRPDEVALRRRLLTEAARHEPDLDRITARVRDGMPAGAGRPQRSAPHPSPEPPPAGVRTRRRRSWAVPVASAAAVVAVLVGVVTVTDLRPDTLRPAAGRTVSTDGAATTPPPEVRTPPTAEPTADLTTGPGADPARVPTAPAAPAPTRAAGAPTPTSPGGSSVVAVSGPVRVERRDVRAPHDVDLRDVPALDWFVAGAAEPPRDGWVPAVRRANGDQPLSGPHQTGDPTPSTRPGPFRTTWDGGAPVRSADASSSWLVVRGRAGGPETAVLVHTPLTAPRTLVLHVGALDVAGVVRVSGLGHAVQVPVPAGGSGGSVVTVTAAGAGAGNLRVEVVAGDGGAVAVAAVVLRS